MTNQRRILGIFWYEFVMNVKVVTLSQLPSINEGISRWRHFLFGHVRRMDQAAPAHQALHLTVTTQQCAEKFGIWRKQPGSPQETLDEAAPEQVITNTHSPSDSSSVATDRSAWRALSTTRRRSSTESVRFSARQLYTCAITYTAGARFSKLLKKILGKS